jgi:hypothetical protein
MAKAILDTDILSEYLKVTTQPLPAMRPVTCKIMAILRLPA